MKQQVKIQFNKKVLECYNYTSQYARFTVYMRYYDDDDSEDEIISFHVNNKDDLIDYIDNDLNDYINDSYDYESIQSIFIYFISDTNGLKTYELVDTLFEKK